MICMFKVIHYCLQMHLKIFRNKCIEIYELEHAHFLSAPGLVLQAFLKKQKLTIVN